MTGQELTELLEKTGTGRDKLRHCKNHLHMRPEATAEEVYLALEEGLRERDPRGAVILGTCKSPGTLSKARDLMEHGPDALKRHMGKPPEKSSDAGANQLAKVLAEKFDRLHEALVGRQEEKQADAQIAGIGRPEKMATAKVR